jgi:hypothetical protein
MPKNVIAAVTARKKNKNNHQQAAKQNKLSIVPV